MSSASLNGANLAGSNLRGANLSNALFAETIMADTDLTEAQGLAETIHPGPSIVDEWTLAKSGSVPDTFLQGGGLSDEMMHGARSQFCSCFISFAAPDGPLQDGCLRTCKVEEGAAGLLTNACRLAQTYQMKSRERSSPATGW